ncbi:MAG: SMP-30/gluconolactonase/LRE family protein [Armatimonadetes bacterium]|nr:SMP-30/gluconolactonase/LRE family protein [Armatimonadota bacterium]
MGEVRHWQAARDIAGETPIWVAEEGLFYWTDCCAPAIHRAAPGATTCETFTPSEIVTALARRASGGWIVLTHGGPAFWAGFGSDLVPAVNAVADRPGHRCNDGAVDRAGRLWLGTMHKEDLNDSGGTLWRVDADLSLHEMATGFAVPNGIAFSPDDTVLYLTDMFHGRIVAYDFDLSAGTIANPRDFAVVPAEDGWPDGLIVDAEGYLWSAHWGGWRVTRYAPDGTIAAVLRLPVSNVTCMGFGGADLRELVITSANLMLSEDDLAAQPLAGDVFTARPGVAGLLEHAFAG